MQTYRTNPPSRAIPARPLRLVRLERAIRDTGISESRAGRMIAKDPALVPSLRAGRDMRPHTLAKIDRWIARQEGDHA